MLPMLILILLSIVMMTIYMFQGILDQTDMHDKLVTESLKRKAVFSIKQEKTQTTGSIEGAVSIIPVNYKKGRIYVINFADTVRLGEMIER